MSDFDYGGEVATPVSKFKKASVGTRNARLFGLLRLGTFREEFHQKGKPATVKDPAPQALAIFHLLGKDDKAEDGSPTFFTKTFPLKKGSKSFLHSKFIPAFGGMAKHTGFGSMIGGLFTLSLKGSKDLDEDGTPKYTNFDSMSCLAEDMLEMLEESPKYAALENPVGFLKESELTEEALDYLHPTREFAGILMQTDEFKAGNHPCQELIQSIFDKDPERYTAKAGDDKGQEEDGEGQQQQQQSQANKPANLPTDDADQDEEF